MQTKHTLLLKITEDTDEDKIMFDRSSTTKELVTTTTWTQQNSGTLHIAQNTNQDIPFGDVAVVKGIYLRVNKDSVKLKINGSADEITMVTTGTGATLMAKFFLEASLSAVNVAAPATEDIECVYCVWGAAS